MELPRVTLGITVVLLTLISLPRPSNAETDMSGIEFCEGKSKYYQAPRSTCKYGYSFGRRLPKCICLQGIYRITMDNCTVEEGFADEVCRHLTADKSKFHSIQLLSEPDWAQTHVVSLSPAAVGGGVNGTQAQPPALGIISLPDIGKGRSMQTPTKTKVDVGYFYAINGRSFIVRDAANRESICVEESINPFDSDKICSVYQEDNPTHWTTMEAIEVTVTRTSCSLNGKVKAILLTTRSCFGPSRVDSSECQLECNRFGQNTITGPNCTDAEEMILFDNRYLDRQMTEHAMMSQLNNLGPLILPTPNRTFDLFTRMVNITNGYCPDEYVPRGWVSHLSELFYVLHKGREYQYEEVLSEDDYVWIGQILDKCSRKGHLIRLSNGAGNDDSHCSVDDVEGKAYGYCKVTDKKCRKPVKIVPTPERAGMKLQSKHYVPELAWSIVDAVQAICFHEFSESYRMFHVLEQAAEKLFTPEIRKLWYNPPYLRDLKRKSRLVGPGADESMYNLEICIGSAYHQTNEQNKQRKLNSDVTLIPRLVRPPKVKYMRRKRRSAKLKSLANTRDVYCAKTKADISLPESCAITEPKPAVDTRPDPEKDPNTKSYTLHNVEDVDWGKWPKPSFCPRGKRFVVGAYVRYGEDPQGYHGKKDERGVDTLVLRCNGEAKIEGSVNLTSTVGSYGKWISPTFENSVVVGIELKVLRYQDHEGDELGVTNIKFYLASMDYVKRGSGPGFESEFVYEGPLVVNVPDQAHNLWRKPHLCPKFHYMCGFATKVDPDTGDNKDDTGLSRMKMYCCEI